MCYFKIRHQKTEMFDAKNKQFRKLLLTWGGVAGIEEFSVKRNNDVKIFFLNCWI